MTSLKDMDAPSAFFSISRNPVLSFIPVCTEERAVMILLLEGLPCLEPEQRAQIESDLTLEELTTTVSRLSLGRSPAIGGLPSNFYKTFCHLLGTDFNAMVCESFSEGLLPISCRGSVLSLLPKKGDLLLLKTWRAVSLIWTEGVTVHHTYCVPGRAIMNNLFSDILDLTQNLKKWTGFH